MKIYGRVLTKKEKEKVLKPFGRNEGKSWTLKSIAKAISAGSAALNKDKGKMKTIQESLNSL